MKRPESEVLRGQHLTHVRVGALARRNLEPEYLVRFAEEAGAARTRCERAINRLGAPPDTPRDVFDRVSGVRIFQGSKAEYKAAVAAIRLVRLADYMGAFSRLYAEQSTAQAARNVPEREPAQ